eukprot:s535_g3.t1
MSLWRPPAMQQDDLVSLMKEVVPRLVDEAFPDSASSAPSSHKRSREADSSDADPSLSQATSKARTLATEVLSVQECHELADVWKNQPVEVMISEYLKKKMSKELHHSNNPVAFQSLVDEGKRVEWETLLAKENAIRIHYGKKAKEIKEKFADRFIGSRFVLTRKPVDEGAEIDPSDLATFRVKGRWCLQGHLDPDLTQKATEGLLKSPTLSQLGRMTLMQIISSHKWDLQLGDIRGAFLEAGPLESRFRPLYAHQPPGGIPGLPADAVIEVLGNVYGQNDAPAAWFREFNNVATAIGWNQSKLDPCLYCLRCPDTNKLLGIMGVHVDDTALGGQGQLFEQAVAKLRQRFPYRKWRLNTGEFCGAWYSQDEDKSITMNMSSFVDKIRPANIPKGSLNDDRLSESQIKVLRAINGSLNWISSQSRPDLSLGLGRGTAEGRHQACHVGVEARLDTASLMQFLQQGLLPQLTGIEKDGRTMTSNPKAG